MNNKNQDQDQKPKGQLNSFARFSGIGFQMLVIIGLGVYGGLKLDEKYPNQYQTFTIICSLAGIAIALYSVIRQVNKFSNRKNNSDEQGNI